VSSVKRSLLILEHLVSGNPPPTHVELARALNIPKGTLSGLLGQLTEEGYIRLVGKQYAPGPALLSLGFRATRRDNLRFALRPVLEQLATETGETAVLAIEVGGDDDTPGQVLGIDYVEGTNPIRYVAQIGRLYPMHSSAAGRVFLAFTGRRAKLLPTDSLVTHTNRTLVDPEELDAELDRIRARGWAMTVGERLDDVTSVSAPVVDGSGRPVAAVTVSGPTTRLPDPAETVWPRMHDAIDAVHLG
jgi:DNA-binding IclR family transcriptional regulator